MQLSIQGKQLDIGDALRSHVNERLAKILSKYFGDAVDVTVTLSREGHHLYRAVVTAHVGRGIRVEAQSEAGEPYPAFDGACDRLSKRLRRHKRRLRHHHGKEGVGEVLPAQQYILAGLQDDGEAQDDSDFDGADFDTSDAGSAESQPIVVADMATEILSLTVSEAVLQLDLADLPALMFKNSAHGGLNMIYRRPDGNIGWIDPHGNQSA